MSAPNSHIAPAPPPTVYEPLDEDFTEDVEPDAIIPVAAAIIVFIMVVAAGVFMVLRKPVDTSPVPQSVLGQIMHNWGYQMGRAPTGGATFAFVTLFMLVFAAGMSQIELDHGTEADWVPTNGRFASQLREWDRLVDDSVTDRSFAFLQIMSENGDNLLDDPKRWLRALLATVQAVYGMGQPGEEQYQATVSATDRNGNPLTLSWRDFCYSINHPLLTSAIDLSFLQTNGTGTNLKPCIQPSPLDAFAEAQWEFDRNSTNPDIREKADSFEYIHYIAQVACAVLDNACGQTSDASQFPSFEDLTDAEVNQRLMMLSNGVGHWITQAAQPWGRLYGDFQGYNNGCAPPSSPGAPVDQSTCDYDLTFVRSFVFTLYQDIPTEVIRFRPTVSDMTADAFRDANYDWLQAMEDKLSELNDRQDGVYNGVRITFYPSDALSRMYSEVADAQTPIIVIGYVLMLLFVVITQISTDAHTNLAVLGFVGFFIVLLSNCAAYGFVAWVLDFQYNFTMVQCLPFLALGLGVDDLFLLLHTFKATMSELKGEPPAKILGSVFKEAGSSITITSWSNLCVFLISAAIIPITALRNFLISAAIIVLFNWLCSMALMPQILAVFAWRFTGSSGGAKAKDCFNDFVSSMYAGLSKSLPGKLICFIIGAGLVIGMCVCIPSVEMGYREADLARRGSYLGEGISDMYEYVYSQHTAEAIVFGEGVNMAQDQKQVLETFQRLADSRWSAYGTALGRSGVTANHWLRNMYTSDGVCPYIGIYSNLTCDQSSLGNRSHPCYNETDPWWAFDEDLNIWRYPQVMLEPRQNLTLAFGGLLAGLLDQANSWVYEYPTGHPLHFTGQNRLILSWDEIELNMQLLQSTSNKIQMIRDFKEITEDSGLNIYMYGWLFIQMEQFLSLDYYFRFAAAGSMFAVFVVTLLMGVSWIGAGIIAIFSILVSLQVYGALYLLDISYQSLSTVNLLISIGIAVEFVAHPVAAFEFAKGTRDERLATAMSRTALPVAFGAISSFLGFVFLAFSDFQFVFNYFFLTLMMVCIFGAVNGLVFLPAVLGLLGQDNQAEDTPPKQVETTVVASTTSASTAASYS